MSPRIHEEGQFSVYVYAPPREHHDVPHVHVESRDGGEAEFLLGSDEMRPTLWRNHHMSRADIRRAHRLVEENQSRFLAKWKELHDVS